MRYALTTFQRDGGKGSEARDRTRGYPGFVFVRGGIMMGRTHAAFGVSAFGAGAWAAPHYLGWHTMTLEQGALGLVVATGAALCPDLDESHSLGGHSNPVSWLPGVFGGHRRRTHCLLAVALVTVVAVACSHDVMATAILAGFMATTGGAILSKRLAHAGALLCVPFGAVVGIIAYHWIAPGWWVTAAVALPYASHLVGDGLTPGGVPWLLPFSQHRSSVHLFRTGKTGERLVVGPLTHVAAAVAVYFAFGSEVATAVGGTLRR